MPSWFGSHALTLNSTPEPPPAPLAPVEALLDALPEPALLDALPDEALLDALPAPEPVSNSWKTGSGRSGCWDHFGQLGAPFWQPRSSAAQSACCAFPMGSPGSSAPPSQAAATMPRQKRSGRRPARLETARASCN
ncbi:hypothetical protein WME75_40305 [Sorangium sp. So ce1014]|uniref:hypothetical protein n=1 Tax=Sorangium sp. So ce1014 TaxID=3133326 RepID=UPI003F5DA22B